MKTCVVVLLTLLFSVPACKNSDRQKAAVGHSSAQIELCGAKIKLYRRGQLVLEAATSTLRAEEINHLWRAEEVSARIMKTESP